MDKSLNGLNAILGGLRALEQDVASVAFERGEAIRLAILALLCRAHVVYLGPPGTGKSFLVEQVTQRVTGARLFSTLLHPQAPAEELLGPLDVAELGKGRYLRRTGGFLPNAEVAFLDEVFKCSPATLNACLGVLNERKLTQDGQRVTCPLVSAFGASNELPRPGEAEALWDRFLLRLYVQPLQEEANVRALLSGGTPSAPPSATVSLADLERAGQVASGLPIPAPVLDALLGLRADLARAGIEVSDRRWTALAGVARAHALLEGRSEVQLEDIAPLAHGVWSTPENRRQAASLVLHVALPTLGTALEELDRALGQHKALIDAKTDEDAVRASIQLRKTATKVKGLVKGCTHPRVLEVAKRVESLQVDSVKRVTGAGVTS